MAICEACWLVENTRWEPESMDENGRIMLRLAGVGMPDSVGVQSVEVCCMCGELTVVGIYVLRSPESVPFPINEKDERFGFTIGLNSEDEIFGGFDDEDLEGGCG
jgi:hypothetical protein